MQRFPRTRVKICGITRPEDALHAANLGADAIGLVFYPRSPRAVELPRARAIVDVLPPFVSVVALFVEPRPALVREVIEGLPVDLLQFHGNERAEDCALFGHPYVKAVAMREDIELGQLFEHYASARALLLDTYRPGVPGGTGVVFDWTRVPRDPPKPVILAGGLEPGNVADAVRRVRPYAVDVSGGVEAAKGVKDPEKVAAFIREVNSVATS